MLHKFGKLLMQVVDTKTAQSLGRDAHESMFPDVGYVESHIERRRMRNKKGKHPSSPPAGTGHNTRKEQKVAIAVPRRHPSSLGLAGYWRQEQQPRRPQQAARSSSPICAGYRRRLMMEQCAW